MAKTGVIGTGTWGTALGMLLADNGNDVVMWSALPEEIEYLDKNRRHPSLGDAVIPQQIRFTGNIREAMEDCSVLVLAVPSIYTRKTAALMKEFYQPDQVIVSVAKGIEDGTLKTLDRQIREEIPGAIVTVLSGPSHAEEVARKLPTTCVIGCEDIDVAERLKPVFMSPVFRVYTSTDVLGMELGGALKNVIALAAGIADGLGYGDNTKAALITRGIAEISRLGTAMGGEIKTFNGLTGIGDLIVTCASMHSRNRRAGILIGQGKSMQEAMDEVHMVVEGVYSARAAKELADKYAVYMPIVNEVNAILFEGKDPRTAVDRLMTRNTRTEN